jgi:3-oxoacyl-[acyl-carrier protein] reductase
MTDDILRGSEEIIKKTIPLKRLGEVSEVANLAVYLASDLSSYITGQVINVCGGLST